MMGKQNEKININAVERDGMRVRILTIQLQYLEAGIDKICFRKGNFC